MNKISVIIPIYNIKKEYLDKCLNSVINQTYKNLEIILVDDGSEEWCKKNYEKFLNDKRIKLIVQKNQGVSVARNNGIKKATGKWIMFVDSDDYLELDCCDKFIKRISKNKDVDIIIAKPYVIKQGKKIYVNNYYKEDKIINQFKDKKELLSCFYHDGGKYLYKETPWAKLYNRDFIITNKLKFNKKLKIGEDGLFLYEYYSLANKMIYIDEAVYNYNINDASISQNCNPKCLKLTNDFNDEFIKLLNKKNIIVLEDEFKKFGIWQLSRLFKRYFISSNIDYKILKENYKKTIKQEPYYSSLREVKFKDLSIYLRIFYFILKFRSFYIIRKMFLLMEKIIFARQKNIK
ncbi:MAG: glycosyltransferase family 2 protein [Bacilli bacterium]|nr:glycosyltransferase family 2 protein [Bacilli bacterium]